MKEQMNAFLSSKPLLNDSSVEAVGAGGSGWACISWALAKANGNRQDFLYSAVSAVVNQDMMCAVSSWLRQALICRGVPSQGQALAKNGPPGDRGRWATQRFPQPFSLR